jgi:hypothetical protein
MDYVVIENGGNGSWNANLYCVSTNQPIINNSTFTMADGYGIRLTSSDLNITSSDLTRNSESGIYIQNSHPSLNNVNFTGNGFAGVEFADLTSNPSWNTCNATNNDHGIHYPTPNYSFSGIPGLSSIGNIFSTISMPGGEITEDQTWPFIEGGYAILGDIVIKKQNDKARLTIAPGNILLFDTAVQFQVGQYIFYNQNYGGELHAIGKPDSSITFTSMNNEIGGWDGIYFHYNSDNFGSESYLTHCYIMNGDEFNVKSDGSVEPRIDHCDIRNSDGYDIYAVNPNDVQHVTNTISTVFVGEGVQNINKTWYNFGSGNYVVVGDITVAKHNDTCRLTIQPGITVEIDTSYGFQIGQYVYYNQDHGGELWAIGNADSMITFTSRNGEIGGWDGIYFHYNSDNFGSESYLTHCYIMNGDEFNVKSDGSAEPRIDHCDIRNSDGYDIYAVNPNDVQHVTNTMSTVYIGDGVQSIDKTWFKFGGKYNVIGDIIIGGIQNNFNTLTIQPGNIIEFDTAVSLQIGNYIYFNQHYGGRIIAEGNADNLIKFYSESCLNKRWDGIYFHSNADNYGGTSSFKHCIISGASTNNMYCDGTDSINFEQVSFIQSGQNGINLQNSSPYLKLCQFVNNDSVGILLTGTSTPVIGDTIGSGCDIYGNGDFGLYNSTINTILARNNFWNTTSVQDISDRIYDINDNAANGEVLYVSPSITSDLNMHPPEMFDLISLPDFEVTSDQSPAFEWNEPNDPDADDFTYYFYYTDDSTWASNILVSNELTNPEYIIPEILTGGKWYWWKIKASDGNLSICSEVWRFAVSLPPTIPVVSSPVNGAHLRETDYLEWMVSSDPDEGDTVSFYHLQIDDNDDFSSPEIDLSNIEANYGSSSISILISDLPNYSQLENKNYFWRVNAVDGFGIESAFSNSTNYFLYLLDVNIKVFLEGPFNGTDMDNTLNNSDLIPLSQPYNVAPWNYTGSENVGSIANPEIIDWLLIELRNTTGSATTATSDKVIYQEAFFVLNDGTIMNTTGNIDLEIPVSFDDNVYMVVHHRNHLKIMTANPLSQSSGLYNIDLSNDENNVIGQANGYKLIGLGVWGMASGDADANGTIELSDINVEWSSDAGNSGFHHTDFSMDGQVNNHDKNEKLINNLGKYSQVPD